MDENFERFYAQYDPAIDSREKVLQVYLAYKREYNK